MRRILGIGFGAATQAVFLVTLCAALLLSPEQLGASPQSLLVKRAASLGFTRPPVSILLASPPTPPNVDHP